MLGFAPLAGAALADVGLVKYSLTPVYNGNAVTIPNAVMVETGSFSFAHKPSQGKTSQMVSMVLSPTPTMKHERDMPLKQGIAMSQTVYHVG